jgi:hypothetical protein
MERGTAVMSRPSLTFLALGLALVLGGCAAKTPYNPFKIPREQFHGHLKVVALSPMGMPTELTNPDPVRQKFLNLIETQLRAAGYKVVGSAEARVIWDSMATGSNGFYDPVTGVRDEEKVKLVRMRLYRELRAKFNIDAMLFSHIAVVPAKLDNDRARWDGASETAARKKFWKAVLGISHSGTIPALSLHVTLSDTDDRDLYENAGGIQVLAKAGVDGLQDVPREQLFADEERNLRAVHLALDPLLGRTTGD